MENSNKMVSIGYLSILKKLLSGRVRFSLQLKGELIEVSPEKPNSCYWGRRYNISLNPFGHNMPKTLIISNGNVAFAISPEKRMDDNFWIPSYWMKWQEDLNFVLPGWTRSISGFWVTEISTEQKVEIFSNDSFSIKKVCTPDRWHAFKEINNETIVKVLENGCFYTIHVICCSDAVVGRLSEIEDTEMFEQLLENWKITTEATDGCNEYKADAEIQTALIKLAIRLELI